MSDITTHLMLPYILAAQAQKHVTHNDALRLLDAMVQLSVLDRNRTAPPLSPVDGDRHIVAPTATGSWAGWDLNVAFWVDGVWMRLVPRPGWTAWTIADAAHTVWNGTAWVSGGKESEQMVNRLKLNEKALRDAEPKPGVSYQIFDTEVIGFAARIQASGARTFTIDYRHAGRQRRMNIGRWPEWSVTAARERAKELRRTIDEGNDPLATREDFREAPRVKDMITRYIAEHLPKLAKNNAADQTSMLKKMVEPTWGKKLVTEITKSDVARFLDFVAEGRLRPSKVKPNNRARKLQWLKPTPIRANRTGEVLRKMFTLASVQSHRAAASCNVKWTRGGSAMPQLLFFLI